MRSGVLAISQLATRRIEDRLLKTRPKNPIIGTVRGIPIYVSGGGLGDTGIFANIVNEVVQLNSEMDSVNSELLAELPPNTFRDIGGVSTLSPIADFSNPLVKFYGGPWLSFYADWKNFADTETGILKRLATGMSIFLSREAWKDIQSYREKLIIFHKRAKEIGFNPSGPDPTPPKKNIFTEAAEAAKAPLDAIWKIVKVIFYAGLVIVGIIVLTYAIGHIRGPSTFGAAQVARGGRI